MPTVLPQSPIGVNLKLDDTIAAISTPPGRGGLGIIRLSGSQARSVVEKILRFPHPPTWKAWKATMAQLGDEQGNIVDEVVVSFFKAPKSYTTEDVVEICCHGSPVILRYCLEKACQAGARLAEPGEFTLRAFLHGRIDLPQAEAVRDLIEATTLYQARVAAQQAGGAVSQRIAPIKRRLTELIALLEAGIDFAEDDVPIASTEEIICRLDPIEHDVARLVASFSYGKLVHDGLVLAIVGRPNVGKSSLFNRLLEQERAIVTDIPGTTRDLVSELASLEGIPVKYIDTAGIREGEEQIERLGIERTYQAMADADLTLVVLDLSSPLCDEDFKLTERALRQGRCLVVGNKCDLPIRAQYRGELVTVSALTGYGIGELRLKIKELISFGAVSDWEVGFITSLRHAQLLRESAEALKHAREAARKQIPHEMILLDLYAALQPIDAITGATTADDILNQIFSTFCIGK